MQDSRSVSAKYFYSFFVSVPIERGIKKTLFQLPSVSGTRRQRASKIQMSRCRKSTFKQARKYMLKLSFFSKKNVTELVHIKPYSTGARFKTPYPRQSRARGALT